MSDIHRFTLKNREGEDIPYIVTPHTYPDNMDVLDAMLELGLGPLVESGFAAFKISAKKKGKPEAGESKDDENKASVTIDMTEIFENMDRAAVVKDVKDGFRRLGMRTLTPMLLKFTTRDGKRLIDSDGSTHRLDQAYVRNYGELAQVIQEVIKYNDFFSALASFFGESEDSTPKP